MRAAEEFASPRRCVGGPAAARESTHILANRSPVAGCHEVRILVGESQSALVELLSRCVEAATTPRDHPTVMSTSPRAEEILRLCRRATFDLVILILNNVIFPEIGVGTREMRQKRWLRFIAEVKGLSRCPMIVFCGWREDDPISDGLHVTEAIVAGANVFFPMPAPTAEIIGAIKKCLYDSAP